jgi:hypothetical protein
MKQGNIIQRLLIMASACLSFVRSVRETENTYLPIIQATADSQPSVFKIDLSTFEGSDYRLDIAPNKDRKCDISAFRVGDLSVTFNGLEAETFSQVKFGDRSAAVMESSGYLTFMNCEYTMPNQVNCTKIFSSRVPGTGFRIVGCVSPLVLKPFGNLYCEVTIASSGSQSKLYFQQEGPEPAVKIAIFVGFQDGMPIGSAVAGSNGVIAKVNTRDKLVNFLLTVDTKIVLALKQNNSEVETFCPSGILSNPLLKTELGIVSSCNSTDKRILRYKISPVQGPDKRVLNISTSLIKEHTLPEDSELVKSCLVGKELITFTRKDDKVQIDAFSTETGSTVVDLIKVIDKYSVGTPTQLDCLETGAVAVVAKDANEEVSILVIRAGGGFNEDNRVISVIKGGLDKYVSIEHNVLRGKVIHLLRRLDGKIEYKISYIDEAFLLVQSAEEYSGSISLKISSNTASLDYTVPVSVISPESTYPRVQFKSYQISTSDPNTTYLPLDSMLTITGSVANFSILTKDKSEFKGEFKNKLNWTGNFEDNTGEPSRLISTQGMHTLVIEQGTIYGSYARGGLYYGTAKGQNPDYIKIILPARAMAFAPLPSDIQNSTLIVLSSYTPDSLQIQDSRYVNSFSRGTFINNTDGLSFSKLQVLQIGKDLEFYIFALDEVQQILQIHKVIVKEIGVMTAIQIKTISQIRGFTALPMNGNGKIILYVLLPNNLNVWRYNVDCTTSDIENFGQVDVQKLITDAKIQSPKKGYPILSLSSQWLKEGSHALYFTIWGPHPEFYELVLKPDSKTPEATAYRLPPQWSAKSIHPYLDHIAVEVSRHYIGTERKVIIYKRVQAGGSAQSITSLGLLPRDSFSFGSCKFSDEPCVFHAKEDEDENLPALMVSPMSIKVNSSVDKDNIFLRVQGYPGGRSVSLSLADIIEGSSDTPDDDKKKPADKKTSIVSTVAFYASILLILVIIIIAGVWTFSGKSQQPSDNMSSASGSMYEKDNTVQGTGDEYSRADDNGLPG